MTTGLQTWDRDGNLLIDMTKPISKVVGYFETGVSSGSISVGIPEGVIFFFQVPVISGGGSAAKKAAVVHNGGGLFTWAFNFPPVMGNYAVNSRVYYGFY